MSTNKPNFELGRDPYTGQFASIKDIFPEHQQEEAEPEHLELRAPEAPAGFRNSQPNPESILIAREELGDLTEEFFGDAEGEDEDDSDIWHDPWLGLEEMAEDEEKIKAAGYYRGRVGKTFISTLHQFDEWDKLAYREMEFDKCESVYLANRKFRADEIDETFGIPAPEKGEDVQDKFEANETIELKKHIIAKDFSDYYLRKLPDGNRQLGSKRKSKEKRNWHQEKYRDAA